MGFFSSFGVSLRKSRQLRKISEKLDTPIFDVKTLLSSDRVAAENELYNLVENDPLLIRIMHQHNASRADLQETYRILVGSGAGGWSRGHFVAASSLCFGLTLDFALSTLQQTRSGEKSQEDIYNIWLGAAFRLDNYFKKGKLGRVQANL